MPKNHIAEAGLLGWGERGLELIIRNPSLSGIRAQAMYLKCHDNSPLLGQTSSPETGDHGRSEREPGPGHGVIRIGHCLESNGTTGGRNGLMPSLALSLMIAARASPPISS